MAQLSIVVPVYNGAEDLERCLASLARCRPADSEILLHDDASTDPRIATMLRSFAAEQPGVRILAATENRGFVASCNAATAAAAPGADILLLNSDTELTRGSIEEMRDRMHESGAAGVRHNAPSRNFAGAVICMSSPLAIILPVTDAQTSTE